MGGIATSVGGIANDLKEVMSTLQDAVAAAAPPAPEPVVAPPVAAEVPQQQQPQLQQAGAHTLPPSA